MQGPVNVGTSVIAFKYKDGLMFCTDTSISYGGTMAVKNACRQHTIGTETIIACSGEMSDFQYLQKQLDQKHEADYIENDGSTFLHSKDYFNWIGQQQYQKRMKGDPLWVSAVVGGINPHTKEVFLGQSDLYGTMVQNDWVLTGLGNHYC